MSMNEDSDFDYTKLNNTPLSEVQCFFSKKAYYELIDLGIEKLGDLLQKDTNGELFKMFYNKHKEAHELWNNIYGTINILKCKYLGTNVNVDINHPYQFASIIGLTRPVRKRIMAFKSLQLPNLLKLVENHDYQVLYDNFSPVVVDEIVNKVSVLNEYYKNKYHEPSVLELKELHNKLAKLVKEYEQITTEIALVQEEINQKTNGGIHK